MSASTYAERISILKHEETQFFIGRAQTNMQQISKEEDFG